MFHQNLFRSFTAAVDRNLDIITALTTTVKQTIKPSNYHTSAQAAINICTVAEGSMDLRKILKRN